MAKFSISFQKTLANEGGYVNDPLDSGGETYKGIARNSHSSWPGWSLIDRHKNKYAFPQTLTTDEKLQSLVEQFYLETFWEPLKADQIQNQTNADSIFDFAVNAGTVSAVRMVQCIVGTKIDCIIGIQSLNKINSMDFGHFQAALTVAKLKFYLNLIQRKPTSKRFLLGWLSRSISFND